MCDEQVIKEKYGKDYTYEKWYSTEIDLEHLPKNKAVVFGDGETYCWMLTKKESVPAETLVIPQIAEDENRTFLETVMVNNGKEWECEFDNNCDETPEPIEELIVRANKFIKGTRIEIHAPLE